MKTILFDFGNVIGFFDHQRAVARLAAHTDMAPHELTLVMYGSPLEEDYEVGKLTTAEYIRLAKRDGRLTCGDDEFIAAFADIFWPNPEVCELIPKLKPKYRLVLASNTTDAHYRKYSAEFADVLKHFDAFCPSHHMKAHKPHAAYYAAVQAHVAAEPGECLFVDDLPSNIEAAERHGWKGVVYRTGGSLPGELRRHGVEIG